MTTTIIEALRTYIATNTTLVSGAALNVDYLGSTPVEYSIVPLPGPRIIEQYLNGGSLREFPFAFQTMASTADNLERLETNGFFESLSDWFETQTTAGVLPTLSTKKHAESIEALECAYLFEQGESDTGVYQVQCKLTYSQEP